MPNTIEKRVTLSPERADQLALYAAQEGITEEALIEHALERLFQERATEPEIAPELQAAWDYLRQLEAEQGAIKVPRTVPPIDVAEIVAVHCVPIDPSSIVRIGETR